MPLRMSVHNPYEIDRLELVFNTRKEIGVNGRTINNRRDC
jgi:hypothetical protein